VLPRAGTGGRARVEEAAACLGNKTQQTMQSDRPLDVTRIVLFVLVIGILLAGSVWTLLPFLSGMIWATTIAVATWPTLLQVERLAGRSRS
jgi:predicted PurR-regulated permease PerM